jgi:hypothetical protein
MAEKKSRRPTKAGKELVPPPPIPKASTVEALRLRAIRQLHIAERAASQ